MERRPKVADEDAVPETILDDMRPHLEGVMLRFSLEVEVAILKVYGPPSAGHPQTLILANFTPDRKPNPEGDSTTKR
jgi:hypothetical protein